MQHLFFILFQAKKSPTGRRAKISIKRGEQQPTSYRLKSCLQGKLVWSKIQASA